MSFETERAPNVYRRKISRNCASPETVRKEVSCTSLIACSEDLAGEFFEAYNRSSGCCELKYGTHIESPDYTFAANSQYKSLEIIYIIHQHNIEFLPVSVHKMFPILKFYVVENTHVQKLSKQNFEKMYEISMIYLEGNQIEVIRSDTFQDLVNLKEIYICKWWQVIYIFLNL